LNKWKKKLQYCVNRLQLAITDCLNNALNTDEKLPTATTAAPTLTYTTEENESAPIDTDYTHHMQCCNTNEENNVMPTLEMSFHIQSVLYQKY
jgi:hypothetical protein